MAPKAAAAKPAEKKSPAKKVETKSPAKKVETKPTPKKEEAKPIASVPESLLKKRKRNEKLAAERVAKTKLLRKTGERKAIAHKHAEQFIKQHRAVENSLTRFRRQAKAAGNFFVEPEAKVAFVIRIKGINNDDPKSRKILRLLRLRQIHNGVFVKLNKATINMLKLVEPYVTYGYPNVKSVKDLLYKRGALKVSKQRIPLTDNAIVEQNLGKLGMLCVEDVINEIFTVGKNFKEVNNAIWPFQLKSPAGGFIRKRNHYVEGGDFGNRETKPRISRKSYSEMETTNEDDALRQIIEQQQEQTDVDMAIHDESDSDDDDIQVIMPVRVAGGITPVVTATATPGAPNATANATPVIQSAMQLPGGGTGELKYTRPGYRVVPLAFKFGAQLAGNQQMVEFDLETIKDKPWRKPGADISDYFNYGFTEDTWKVYCARHLEMRKESVAKAEIKNMPMPVNVPAPAAPFVMRPPPPPPSTTALPPEILQKIQSKAEQAKSMSSQPTPQSSSKPDDDGDDKRRDKRDRDDDKRRDRDRDRERDRRDKRYRRSRSRSRDRSRDDRRRRSRSRSPSRTR